MNITAVAITGIICLTIIIISAMNKKKPESKDDNKVRSFKNGGEGNGSK